MIVSICPYTICSLKMVTYVIIFYFSSNGHVIDRCSTYVCWENKSSYHNFWACITMYQFLNFLQGSKNVKEFGKA